MPTQVQVKAGNLTWYRTLKSSRFPVHWKFSNSTCIVSLLSSVVILNFFWKLCFVSKILWSSRRWNSKTNLLLWWIKHFCTAICNVWAAQQSTEWQSNGVCFRAVLTVLMQRHLLANCITKFEILYVWKFTCFSSWMQQSMEFYRFPFLFNFFNTSIIFEVPYIYSF